MVAGPLWQTALPGIRHRPCQWRRNTSTGYLQGIGNAGIGSRYDPEIAARTRKTCYYSACGSGLSAETAADKLAAHAKAPGMNSKQEQTKDSKTTQSRPKVRWGRIVLITFAVLLLLVAGAITALFTVESRFLQPVVERIVTVLIERPFILEGNFEADLGRLLTVRADGVKIGNGVWSSEPYMLSVDQPYAVLDLWALTRGKILIRDAKAKSGRLLFELSPDGKLNWDLSKDSPDKEPAGPRLKAIPLFIEQADLNDIHITLDLPAFELPLEIQVDSAKQKNGADDVLDLVIAGSINEKPVNVSGHIGPFTTLIAGRNVDFDLDLDLHTFELDGKGQIDDLVSPEKLEFELALKAPDAAELIALLRLAVVTHGPVALQASMKPADSEFKANVNGDFGEFRIDLTATLQALNTIDGLKLDVNASGPDLSVPAALVGLGALPKNAYQLTGQIEESGGALSIKNLSLEADDSSAYLDGVIPQFPKFAGATLNAGVKGQNYLKFRQLLRLAEGPSLPEAFEIEAALNPGADGQPTVRVTGSVGGIDARVNGDLGTLPELHGSRFDVEFSGPDTKRLAEAFGLPSLISEPFNASMNVELTTKGIRIRSGLGQVGRRRVNIDGLLGYAPLVTDTDINLHFVGDHLDEIMMMAGLHGRVSGCPLRRSDAADSGQRRHTGETLYSVHRLSKHHSVRDYQCHGTDAGYRPDDLGQNPGAVGICSGTVSGLSDPRWNIRSFRPGQDRNRGAARGSSHGVAGDYRS